jgi:hypothetical protein
MKIGFIAVLGTASLVASADAGILGFAAFSRTIGGNKVVDLVAVTERASDRVLNIFNVNSSSTFVQLAGLSTRGFKPDAATSNRNNGVDSFCTIGVQGGAPYYGEYYAAGNTGPDGGFTTGWTTLGNTMPANCGWFISPPTGPDNVSESLANFSGTRANSSAAAAGGSFGVWLGHWVFAGNTTSALISATVSVKDGVSGATVTGSAQGFEQLGVVPAPSALALLGLAGFTSRRRRA